jgi:hypothetical protein
MKKSMYQANVILVMDKVTKYHLGMMKYNYSLYIISVNAKFSEETKQHIKMRFAYGKEVEQMLNDTNLPLSMIYLKKA